MLTLKIIWCKIGELFWGFVADITWKLVKLFEPDYERLEKMLEERKKINNER